MTDFLSQDINDYCFIDTETLSGANLKETGIYPYTADPSFRVMIVTYAIGEGEPQIWKQERAHVGDVLCFDDAPQDLIDFAARVAEGKAWFVAWNAAFDRLALSRGLDGLGWLTPAHFLDAMAQAVRSHLPPDLAGAAKTVKAEVQKRPDGKRLIQQFCVPPFAAPAEHPDEWAAFCLYALDDIPSMRAVWQATMPLSRMEWEQYWASERVNDRGMPVDRAFVEAASALAEENAIRASADIARLTGGAIRTVNQHEALCAWVLDRVDHLSEAKAILLREVVEEQEEEGDGVVRLERHSLERSRVEDLIAYLARLDEEQGLTDDEWQVYQVLQVRAYGASATPRKFTKALPMLTADDRLCGQYVFNGAAATGRFSSRGLQIHNLTRSTVGDQTVELAIIDQVQDRVPFDVFAEHGPVGRTLSRLIRPMFVAPDGMKMVWADYSAIEARVLPWLGEAFGGGSVLDIFRANDADPSLPDIYKRQAGSILGKDANDVTKAERQSHGKVPCIAAGQLVLTDRGLVPIEDVTVDMRVWDGVKFVSHHGSVLKGVKDVWEYQGLVATADHIVWTEEVGPCEFLIAARRGYNLVKSGHGRCPVRVGGDHRSRDSVHARKMAWCLRKDALHRVRSSVVAGKVELIAGAIEGMPSLFAPAPDTQVAGPQTNRGKTSLHEPKQPAMGWVRGARDRVSFCVRSGGGSVHTGKSWLEPTCGDRPNRQQRALRSGEPALGYPHTTELEQAHERPADVGVSAERMALRQEYGEAEAVGGDDACRDTGRRRARRYRQTEGLAQYRGKARVYDIVNAGPRHRFTVSGVLVHNCLSLGFGGGKGALFNMARAYGASFTDAEAGDIVNKWRAVNPWARAYWDDTWEAAIWCMHNPGTPRAVGSRLTYVYLPEYMGGTLVGLLPDGRPLLYPAIKWEKRERKDKMTGKIEVKEQLTYRRGYGRAALWYGTLVENAVQAVAGSLLRHVIWRLDREWPQLVVGHVHDEVVALTALQDVAAGREALRRAMLDLPAWAEGLPIACEASESFYYTKTVD